MFVTSDILPKQIPWFGLTLNIVYFKTLAMIRVEEDERWMLFPVLVSSQNTVTSCGKRRDSVSFFQMHPNYSWFRDESLNKFSTSANELLSLYIRLFPNIVSSTAYLKLTVKKRASLAFCHIVDVACRTLSLQLANILWKTFSSRNVPVPVSLICGSVRQCCKCFTLVITGGKKRQVAFDGN